jgi:hypothetical protein
MASASSDLAGTGRVATSKGWACNVFFFKPSSAYSWFKEQLFPSNAKWSPALAANKHRHHFPRKYLSRRIATLVSVMDDRDRAKDLFLKALALKPDLAEAWLNDSCLLGSKTAYIRKHELQIFPVVEKTLSVEGVQDPPRVQYEMRLGLMRDEHF